MKLFNLKNLIVVAALASMVVSNAHGAAASGSATLNFATYNDLDGNLGKIFNVGGVTALSGTGFTAQLWAGSVNSEGSLVALGVATFATGAAAGYVGFGQPFGPASDTFNVPGGLAKQTVFYQVRAWDNASGSSYATATIRGKSGIISTVAGGDASDGFPSGIAPDVNGFANFSLAVVPEPSILALGMLGGAVLLFRRRK